MIEKIIRDFLLQRVQVPVYVDVKDNPPGSYLVIERTGGSMENHIRKAMVAVQSIAPTQYAAAELHESVLRHMQDLIELDEIGKVEINAESHFPNQETKTQRYQAVFYITYY